jgi:putative ABC transport system permease protein
MGDPSRGEIDHRHSAIDRRHSAIDRRHSAIDRRHSAIDRRHSAIDRRHSAIDHPSGFMPGGPGWQWILRMAWRDSRGQRRLLLLFTLSIVAGIGALVAIRSLRDNLAATVELQARALLGADLVVSARRPFGPEMEAFIAGLGGDQARELRFRSMAVFPGRDGAGRFVQVRALAGAYPFYGDMETLPAGGLPAARPGEPPLLLAEESLLLQLGLAPGDPVRLGEQEFRLAGALLRMAGESEVAGIFAPRVYIPLDSVTATGLVQFGSVAQWRVYFRFAGGLDEERLQRLRTARDGLFIDAAAEYETVAQRRRGVERVLGNLFNFLNLVGFIALLLGGVGVATSVQVFLEGKIPTIALLRCLGTPGVAAFRIYLLQVMTVGLAGALVGAGCGVAVQFLLPRLLDTFLPLDFSPSLSLRGIGGGLLFGWLVATLFALLPLLRVRRTSPLRALRADVETVHRWWRDPFAWLLAAALLALLGGFSIVQAGGVRNGLGFAAGLLLALAVLVLLAWALRALLRRLAGRVGPYVWRLGLSNLYRPHNRTLLLLVTLGMGVLLIHTLFLTRQAMLGLINVRDTGDAANAILLDVQHDQLDGLLTHLDAQGHRLRDVLPVVTMRVAAINGETLREIRESRSRRLSSWIYTWEFRNTYRDHVLDNAEVIAGAFTPRYEGPEPYPISLSENVLEDLGGVGIGDRIRWDVQGVPLETVVDSVRRIRWQAGRQNFNVVFPLGTIEAAPTVYAVTVQVADRAESARLQTGLAADWPNISLLDLSLVFETVNRILDRAGWVVQFMAGFTIVTGLIVLAGAVWTSRYQRVRESVLLRTLGASGVFIRRLLFLEFAILGALAGAAGLLLSLGAAWGLLHLYFELPLTVDWLAMLGSFGAVWLLTIGTGLWTSRGIASQPPLAVLRGEE